MALNIKQPQVGGSSSPSIGPFLSLAELLLQNKMKKAEGQRAEEGLNEWLQQQTAEENALRPESLPIDIATGKHPGAPEAMSGLAQWMAPKPTAEELAPMTPEEQATPVPAMGDTAPTSQSSLEELLKQVPGQPQTLDEMIAPQPQAVPESGIANVPFPQERAPQVPKGLPASAYSTMAAAYTRPDPKKLENMLFDEVKSGRMPLEQALALRKRAGQRNQILRTAEGYVSVDPSQTGYIQAPGGGGNLMPPERGIKVVDAQGNVTLVSNVMGSPTAPQRIEGVHQATAGERAAQTWQERAKWKFTNMWDPEIGRTQRMSDYDIYNRIQSGGELYAPADMNAARPALGMVPEVYQAVNLVRQAAQEALKANNGQLKFDPDQLLAANVLLTHHRSTLSPSLLRNYLTQLTTAATDPATLNYVNRLKFLYEAMQPIRGISGVKGGATDTQYLALLNAAPGPTDIDGKTIEDKLSQLENQVAIVTSSMPNVRGAHGYSIKDINLDMMHRREGMPFEQSVLGDILLKQGHGMPGVTQPTTTPAAPAAPKAPAGMAPRLPGESPAQYLKRTGGM